MLRLKEVCGLATDAQLPDWANEKMPTKVRVALWLATQVGEGNVFSKDQLRTAFPAAAQIDRRVRELRNHDWVIATSRDDVSLAPHEMRFVRAGALIWEPGVRAELREQSRALAPPRTADPEHYFETRALTTIRQATDPEAVWERLQELSRDEKSIILAWIAMGRRPSSPVELAWRAYRSLPEARRREMAARLGELVSSELHDESLAPDERSVER
ncbi:MULTISPECIES: hypothetical protein [unclassified Streptomyces]|uniref:hypothetical protein n=1 Tax=unclassified Streptomyces TaxID=2593676 RepID=UPI0001C18AF7|nr:MULTISPECIES: hypothetical protein [unclassified Streptomyces]AEN11345.1 hypothetical protein SACTE_3489 [Streptomyces sp. SirexAA-E]MYR67536.1 hypothetical protein [Streptomyces sp. SID4939]MYR99066.1 hypothetical protein [Streptomyces sp. SID4940]MYT63391.1 hypothetical protein [Streptomyces sp. SID8357]MYT85641.1 hypothetical protein [Streptomyces sp. SID8360]